MRQLKIKIKGVTPLLMHSNRGVNPMDPIAKKIKAITSKRKRTDEDEEELLRLKWLVSIYYDDVIGPYIPAVNVEATLREAAKKTKQGTTVKRTVVVEPDLIPLIYPGPRRKEDLLADPQFGDFKIGKIGISSVPIYRPRFTNWSLEFTLRYDEKYLNQDDIESILVYAGQYVGLCDYRPKYGKFEIVSFEAV